MGTSWRGAAFFACPVVSGAELVTLPNNPRECREQAQLYADLASAAERPEDREHFASLAESCAVEQIELDEPKYFEAEYTDAA
jgi:hypothetical protein